MSLEYTIFLLIVVLALVFDLYIFSGGGKEISFKSATLQSVFWIALSLAFGIYVYMNHDPDRTLEYYTAYLMEKSLSVDNIVVFLMIFNGFAVPRQNIFKALTIGIILAIMMRIAFIITGVAIVNRFEIILVFFGLFLIMTSFRMAFPKEESESDVQDSKVYKFLSRIFRINLDDKRARIFGKMNGKSALTQFGLVVLMIAFSDFVFALDSLPTVLAISRDQFVVLSSNVFAVLGLRALYYLMQNAIEKFSYLQQGVGFVLFFIGVKLILGFMKFHIPELASLVVVILALSASIVYSLFYPKSE